MVEPSVGPGDSFFDLERHRLQLEQNVAKLQASLRHWQTWEIEYEVMKEEILELGDVHSCSDLGSIGDARNELLTPKERKTLLLDERGNVRDSQQVIGLLSRRIDYVQQNIKSVSSLLNKAQDKYAAAQVLSKPEVRNEEGLPLTEIHEELDEEGNVISFSVSEPSQAAPQLLESLRKAGVMDLPSQAESSRKAGVKDPPSEAEDKSNLVQTPETNHRLSDNKTNAGTVGPNSSASKTQGSVASKAKASEGQKSRNTRKSVSFTADTKKESLLEHKSKMRIPTLKRDDLVNPVDGPSEGDVPHRQPVIPPNESPAHAALRRQMIEYNLSEVNKIVAEMDIDDEGSDASHSDDSSLEDEDQFGRSNKRMLSDEYLAEMRALEQKLNAKVIQNVGPNAELGGSATSSSREEEDQPSSSSSSSSPNDTSNPPTTKSVRFAEEVAIVPRPSIPAESVRFAEEVVILPRPSTPADLPPTPPPQTRNPPKSIHATTIVERPYSSAPLAPPDEPDGGDDLDPAMLQQQVRTHYHQARNRFIQREGGFTDDPNDRAEVPLTEAEGGPKKMSRFKAARLGGSSKSG